MNEFSDAPQTRCPVVNAIHGGNVMRMTVAPKRVVLVTGASSGIGQACAEFSRAAWRPRVWRLAPAGARRACRSIAMDVTDDASVRDAVSSVMARAGRIDVV